MDGFIDEEQKEQIQDETVEMLLDVLEGVRNEPNHIQRFTLSRDLDEVYGSRFGPAVGFQEKSRSRELQIEKPNKTITIEITEY